MICCILLIMIGIKLNMLHGLYLALIIIEISLKVISLAIGCYKAGER